jgi:hypothetical protein
MIKWKKQGRNSRRAAHYEFWDGVDKDDDLICFIRLDARHGHYEIFSGQFGYHGMETQRFGTQPFKTLKDAKGHCIAWLVNKRLEEA